jgi:ABC-2 type transport system permease protein
MRLLRAEWSRLFARRLTRVMILLLLGGLAAIAVGSAVDSHRPTVSDRATAKLRADDARRFYERERTDCEQARDRGEDITNRYPPNCDFSRVTVSDDDYLPHQFVFRTDVPIFITVAAGLLSLFGFLVGASFVGAEWTSGGMANLLLWRPRRWAVLTAKLVTVLLGVLLTSVLALGALVGAFWFTARYRGMFGALTRGFWESLALTGARAVAFGMVAAVAGFAIASLGRHTAMALGAGLAYALVVEVGARIVLSALEVANPDRYALSSYAAGWLEKRYELLAPAADCAAGDPGCGPAPYVITWQMSAAVLGAIVLVLLLSAYVSMRRRDVA